MLDDDDFDDGVERNGPQQGLAEVERALSILGGRHPEMVRAEREGREAKERRRRELEAQAVLAKRRTRNRALSIIVVVIALGGGGYAVSRAVERESAQAARVEPAAARFIARGFVAAPRALGAKQNEAEADVPDRACVVVVAAPDVAGASVRIEHANTTDTIKGSGMFCTCASEHVLATANVPVRIVSIEASSVGGMRAAPFLNPLPATLVSSGEGCAIDAFTAWVSGPHAPPTTSPTVAPALTEVGFAGVTAGGPPFIVVHGAAENTCFLATSPTPITLESAESAPIVTGPTLAWCDVSAELRVLSGTSKIEVVSAPARRVGGLLGLREASREEGTRELVTWVSDDDLGRVAATTLAAVLVPEPASVRGALRKEVSPNARVLSFVGRAGGHASADELGNAPTYDADAVQDIAFACEPPGTDALESLCVQSAPLTWKPHGALSAAGVAYGPLPFWMSAIDATTGRDSTIAKLAVLRLARHLTARGFDPTIIEGVTEKLRGVEILGRSGEDAIVAVGLWPSPPWVVPYSHGVPWTLDTADPPRIPIQSGARLALDAPITPTASEKARRTVVFRHAIKR